MSKRWMIGAAAVALAASFAPDAWATTSCSFASTVGVSFGSYDVFQATPLDSMGSLTYLCQGVGTSDSIVIQLSRGSSFSYAPRTLLFGGWSLGYNLYLDAARTLVWGDGASGTNRYGPIHPSEIQTALAVYGRIPARQNVAAGHYADTIVATIVF